MDETENTESQTESTTNDESWDDWSDFDFGDEPAYTDADGNEISADDFYNNWTEDDSPNTIESATGADLEGDIVWSENEVNDKGTLDLTYIDKAAQEAAKDTKSNVLDTNKSTSITPIQSDQTKVSDISARLESQAKTNAEKGEEYAYTKNDLATQQKLLEDALNNGATATAATLNAKTDEEKTAAQEQLKQAEENAKAEQAKLDEMTADVEKYGYTQTSGVSGATVQAALSGDKEAYQNSSLSARDVVNEAKATGMSAKDVEDLAYTLANGSEESILNFANAMVETYPGDKATWEFAQNLAIVYTERNNQETQKAIDDLKTSYENGKVTEEQLKAEADRIVQESRERAEEAAKVKDDVYSAIIESYATAHNISVEEAIEELPNAKASYTGMLEDERENPVPGTSPDYVAKSIVEEVTGKKETSSTESDTDENENFYNTSMSDGEDETTTVADDSRNDEGVFDFAEVLNDAMGKDNVQNLTQEDYQAITAFRNDNPVLFDVLLGTNSSRGLMTNADKSAAANLIAGIKDINNGHIVSAIWNFTQATGLGVYSLVQHLAASGLGVLQDLYYGAKAVISGSSRDASRNGKTYSEEDIAALKDIAESEPEALYEIVDAVENNDVDAVKTVGFTGKNTKSTNYGNYNKGITKEVSDETKKNFNIVVRHNPSIMLAIKKW